MQQQPTVNTAEQSHGLCSTHLSITLLLHTRFAAALLLQSVIAESEREGTRAETRIGLSAKRTSPFKSAGGSVQ